MRGAYLEVLDRLTRPAVLQDSGQVPGKVVCTACPHRCSLAPQQRGVCGVRFFLNGELRAPWGYTSGVAVDPLEKKPLYHVCPGTGVLSFGMLGCNLHCPFCQNWHISQITRDERASSQPHATSPEFLVAAAERSGSRWIAATYNEPLIAPEWVAAVFQAARAAGLRTCVVSNGYASAENLAYLGPWLDAANIDLKCFTEKGYRWLGGSLQPVLETIRYLRQRRAWVEVTTLVIPGFNDSSDELRQVAAFLASVSPDLPWHVSAYHPDYRMSDGPPSTPMATLEQACDIGRDCGVRYVYTGNVRGARKGDHTQCPGCGTTLVVRQGFSVLSCRVDGTGVCPDCQMHIAGIWQ